MQGIQREVAEDEPCLACTHKAAGQGWFGLEDVTLAEGATVADILSHLKLATTTASAINGTQIEKSHVLKDGDQVQLFRQLGGG